MPERLTVLAFDLGATWLKSALFASAPLELLRFERCATPDDPEDCRNRMEAIWSAWGAPARAGLAAAPELERDGVVRRWPNRPRYRGVSVIPEALRLPAHVVTCDDGTAGALSAATGLGPGQVTVFAAVGSGVGGGAVIGETPLLGRTGAAMDIGHIRVPAARDEPCPCGRRGCVQAVASGRALARAMAEAKLDDPDIFQAAANSPVAAWILARASRALAEAFATLERIFDADRYILGGGLAQAALLDAVTADADRLGFSGRLAPHPWGERAALAGAALAALRKDLGADRLSWHEPPP